MRILDLKLQAIIDQFKLHDLFYVLTFMAMVQVVMMQRIPGFMICAGIGNTNDPSLSLGQMPLSSKMAGRCLS